MNYFNRDKPSIIIRLEQSLPHGVILDSYVTNYNYGYDGATVKLVILYKNKFYSLVIPFYIGTSGLDGEVMFIEDARRAINDVIWNGRTGREKAQLDVMEKPENREIKPIKETN